MTLDRIRRSLGRRHGFTMLELIIVVLIIGLGLLVALPRIRTMGRQQLASRSALLVAGDLRSAFTSAARGRVPVRVSIPGDTTGYALINTVTGDTILRRRFSEGTVRVSDMGGNGVTLTVFPNGVATLADTFRVQVAASATMTYTKQVTMSRIGFVRVLP